MEERLKIVAALMCTPLIFIRGGYQLSKIYIEELKEEWKDLEDSEI